MEIRRESDRTCHMLVYFSTDGRTLHIDHRPGDSRLLLWRKRRYEYLLQQYMRNCASVADYLYISTEGRP